MSAKAPNTSAKALSTSASPNRPHSPIPLGSSAKAQSPGPSQPSTSQHDEKTTPKRPVYSNNDIMKVLLQMRSTLDQVVEKVGNTHHHQEGNQENPKFIVSVLVL